MKNTSKVQQHLAPDDEIRRLLNDGNASGYWLAKTTGLPQSTIYRYMSGKDIGYRAWLKILWVVRENLDAISEE
jgi:predicted transcriptional regulator